METTTLFIILDGFRHDYLERTSYLKNIASWHGKVREPFGFISTRPAMFAGVHPEQTNLAFEYRFDPAQSTFSKTFARTTHLLDQFLPTRYVRALGSAFTRLTNSNPVARQSAYLGNMPFKHLPLLALSETRLQNEDGYLETPTFFDLLRQNQETCMYYGFARPKEAFEFFKRIYSVLIKKDLHEADRTMNEQYIYELDNQKHSFMHLHYASCDWVGHKFGPDTPEMEQTIQVVDSLVKQVHEETMRRYKHVRLVVTADHGMVNVTESHNLEEEVLSFVAFSQPNDYLCFQDSTMARFWFFNPKAEEAIRAKLEALSWGKIIEGDERQKHRVRFEDNRNGDLIFLLNPGVVLVPNFYQDSGAPPRGMHGYAPETLDNQGAIVFSDSERQVALDKGETIDLVDIFPTLCDLHQFPCPQNVESKSILKPK